jgi:hypothetical protein
LIAAGGEAFHLWAAWRFGGEDPWRLYNMLDPDFRPVGASDLPPVRPRHPRRLKAFVYACARASARFDGKVTGIIPPQPGVAAKGKPKTRARRGR